MHLPLFLKVLTISIAVFLSMPSKAQNIEGLWIGSLKTSGSNVHYELWITKEKENYTGYALSLMVIDGVENIGVKTVKLKLKNKTLFLEDENLVYNNFKTPPKKNKLIARLYTKSGSDSLNGTFNTRSLDFTDRTSYEGDLELVKSNDSNQSFLLGKLAQLNLVTEDAIAISRQKHQEPVTEKEITQAKIPADKAVDVSTKTEVSVTHKINKIESEDDKPVIKPVEQKTIEPVIKVFDPFENRKIEIIETVLVSLDSVSIALYDNGIIDGDTVSIYVNGKLHLEKKELGTAAIRSTIYFPASVDSLELIMYAENLGTLPPNTGLLIIEDGNNRQEIRFSGDLQKNAAILLRRKK